MKKLLILLLVLVLAACQKQTDKMYKYSYQVNKDIVDSNKVNLNQTSKSSEPSLKPTEIKKNDNTNNPKHGILNDEDKKHAQSEDVLEIGEKLYIAQINDIYYNFDQYKDKTIIIEGMFTYLKSYKGDEKPAVYRLGPGCCGNDGWGGFILDYDHEYPKPNDWIRVKGKLKMVEKNHYRDLILIIDNLEIKAERGAEYVAQ